MGSRSVVAALLLALVGGCTGAGGDTSDLGATTPAEVTATTQVRDTVPTTVPPSTSPPTTGTEEPESDIDPDAGREATIQFGRQLEAGAFDAAYEMLSEFDRSLLVFWATLASSASIEELDGRTLPVVRWVAYSLRADDPAEITPAGMLALLNPGFFTDEEFEWSRTLGGVEGRDGLATLLFFDGERLTITAVLQTLAGEVDAHDAEAAKAGSEVPLDPPVPLEGLSTLESIAGPVWDAIVLADVEDRDSSANSYPDPLRPETLLGLASSVDRTTIGLLTFAEATAVAVLKAELGTDLGSADVETASETLFGTGALRLVSSQTSESMTWEMGGISSIVGRSDEGIVTVILEQEDLLTAPTWSVITPYVGVDGRDFPDAFGLFSSDPVGGSLAAAGRLLGRELPADLFSS